MPTCTHCNRPFVNKDALHQHLASSGNQHPFCEKCDRRFISQVALESHIAAKHPPTNDCELCKRSFNTLFALDDHYRGSTAHPNCARCGRGFKDLRERDEHRKTSHRLVACSLCDGVSIDEDALAEHYNSSNNHPSCTICGWSFKDDAAYANHVVLFHPELWCNACEENFKTVDDVQKHYADSMKHKKCDECGRGCKDDAEYIQHVQEAHKMSTPSPKYPNTGSNDQTNTTTHHHALPPPSQAIGQAWFAKEDTPLRSSFASLYVPRHTISNTPRMGQTLYSSSEVAMLPSADTRPREPASSARRTSGQWPLDRSFDIQSFIPPQIPTQPRRDTRVESQQSIPPFPQQHSWALTNQGARNGDDLRSRTKNTDDTPPRVVFNPFGPPP